MVDRYSLGIALLAGLEQNVEPDDRLHFSLNLNQDEECDRGVQHAAPQIAVLGTLQDFWGRFKPDCSG